MEVSCELLVNLELAHANQDTKTPRITRMHTHRRGGSSDNDTSPAMVPPTHSGRFLRSVTCMPSSSS